MSLMPLLNADLDTISGIYIKTYYGYQSLTNDECLKLHQALYGLKQTPREWNAILNSYLIEKGFTRLNADNCIYIRGEISKGKYVIISIYINDILIAGQNMEEINRIKSELNSK